MEEISRQFYWNAELGRWLIYPMFVIALGALVHGLRGRYRLWRAGVKESRNMALLPALWRTFSQRDVLRLPIPGSAHLLLFWGFVLLTAGTGLIFLQEDFLRPLFSATFLHGSFYLVFSFVLDVAGLAALLAVLYFIYRRYLRKPELVLNKREDLIILVLLALILAGGFLVEGMRIAATNNSFDVWSPVGWALAAPLRGLAEGALLGLHALAWWSHLALAFVFIAYLGYSKLMHILTAPFNTLYPPVLPAGALAPIENIEEAEDYGVSKASQYSWKQLLDSDACMRCGRCQDVCPAWNTGKPLSPRQVVLDVRDAMEAERADVASLESEAAARETPRAALIGGRITEEEIWACTTCRSCQEHCPVSIEHIQKIVDLRRYLVLSESRFPAELNAPYRSLETSGCPWSIPAGERGSWHEGLSVPTLEENPEAEYLWWVGCAADVDEHNKRSARALLQLLQAAGVNFAIVGNEEQCCGDPARRTGNEYLYQMLAQANVEFLKEAGVRKLIVHCPHCFNTLKNEYPQFGGDFTVLAATELLASLLESGALKLTPQSGAGKVTFHDPCYLGRHNGIYEQPRQLLRAAGAELVEMPCHGADSFCCGGGGGRSWLEERSGERINQRRTAEAIATGAGTVVSACPYCMSMLVNGVADLEAADKLAVRDFSELLLAALPVAPAGTEGERV